MSVGHRRAAAAGLDALLRFGLTGPSPEPCKGSDCRYGYEHVHASRTADNLLSYRSGQRHPGEHELTGGANRRITHGFPIAESA
jgi:hypothetical protein